MICSFAVFGSALLSVFSAVTATREACVLFVHVTGGNRYCQQIQSTSAQLHMSFRPWRHCVFTLRCLKLKQNIFTSLPARRTCVIVAAVDSTDSYAMNLSVFDLLPVFSVGSVTFHHHS